MLFVTEQPLALLVCPICGGAGWRGVTKCRECRGMGAGITRGKQFLHFGEPLTHYEIALRRGRRLLQLFRISGSLIFAFGFLVTFAVLAYQRHLLSAIIDGSFWFKYSNLPATFFWLALVAFSYLLYRALTPDRREVVIDLSSRTGEALTPDTTRTWADVKKLSHKDRRDIANHFTTSAHRVIEDAFALAERSRATEVGPDHLFLALLSYPAIEMLFLRLGVTKRLLTAKIAEKQSKESASTASVGSAFLSILFHALVEAENAKQQYVHVPELLLCAVRSSETLQEMLYDMGIDAEKLNNMVAWVRIREKLLRSYRSFARAAAHHNKYGLDRAMTAVATPYLNTFSRDLTALAAAGYLSPCIARDKEMDEVFRIVEGGRQSVLLVGDRGVGKMSLIEGVAQRMVEGRVPQRLFDKRLVQLSTSALMAGTTIAGAQERLIRIMNEVQRAGNIILFIHNIHDLMSVTNSQGEGLDVSETLAEYLGKGSFFSFATTTREGFNRFVTNSELGTVLSPIPMEEMDSNQAIQVLESKVGFVEYKQNVFFSYDALAAAVGFAQKFLHDQRLPESAIMLMSESATYVHGKRGEGQIVAKNDVAAVVGEKTGIPTTSISEDESSKLMRLEEEMHQRVVGQDEAVTLVANALRRARAEIRSDKKPIANFLFLGPTGVGKTELAKTIASVYFGGEDRMVRLDMSEFQDTASVYRLIGAPGQQGTGLLTEAVRQHPFTLVLLDELEKADKNVLNVFLQVFDDGRLTDSVGRVIDFTNTIIIATSNAGTNYVEDALKKGETMDQIREQLIRQELRQYYRPEFLNRFDAIVLFRSLTRDNIKTIASYMLKRVGHDLEKRGVDLRVEPAALEALADVGFDPEFGARPMRRAIQDRVENQLAGLILGNALKRRDTVVVGDGLTLRVENPS